MPLVALIKMSIRGIASHFIDAIVSPKIEAVKLSTKPDYCLLVSLAVSVTTAMVSVINLNRSIKAISASEWTIKPIIPIKNGNQ